MSITLKYSCHECGLYKIELSVPEREEEDVLTWMENTVGIQIKNDHSSRSPQCKSESIQDLMIPIPEGTQKVGGPVAH